MEIRKMESMPNINMDLDHSDHILLNFLSEDKTLRNYIIDCRRSLGIPKQGYSKHKPIPLNTSELKYLLKDISWKVNNIIVAYELSTRWFAMLHTYILLNEVAAPEPRVTVNIVPAGVEILVKDTTHNISKLKEYLKDNGLGDYAEKAFPVKSTRIPKLTFEKYQLRLRIAQLKEMGKDSSEILGIIRDEFMNEELPDPLRADLICDTTATNYINTEYKRIKELLTKLSFKSRLSIRTVELQRLAMLKRANSLS